MAVHHTLTTLEKRVSMTEMGGIRFKASFIYKQGLLYSNPIVFLHKGELVSIFVMHTFFPH